MPDTPDSNVTTGSIPAISGDEWLDVLNFPVDRLRISKKAKYTLLTKRIHTAGDILNLDRPLVELQGVAFGSGKVQKVLIEVKKLAGKGVKAYVDRPANIVEFVTKVLQTLKQRRADVLTLRIGLGNQPMTLEEIGEKFVKTRQWAQLLQKKALATMVEDHPEAVEDLLAAVQSILEKHSHFCELSDLGESPYLGPMLTTDLISPVTVGRLVMLLTDRAIRVYREKFLTTLEDELIAYITDIIDDNLRRLSIPFKPQSLYREVKDHYPDVSESLLHYHLFGIKEAEMDRFGNVVRLRGLSMLDKIQITLQNVNAGLYYKDILALMQKSRFAEDFEEISENNIHNRMDMDDRFLLVGRGTYVLGDNFKIQDEKVIIAEAQKILKELGKPTDTTFLLKRLKEPLRGLAKTKINKYSLAGILRTSLGFISGRQLVVGLEEFGDQSPAELSAIVNGILEESPGPLQTSDIYSRLQEIRGTRKYVLHQLLANNPGFLRFSFGVYGLRKHIPFDDETIARIQATCLEYLGQNPEQSSLYSLMRYVSSSGFEKSDEKKFRENLLAILSLSEKFEIKGTSVTLGEDHKHE